MDNFTNDEKEFFKRLGEKNTNAKYLVSGILLLLVVGALIDAIFGFHVLKSSTPFFYVGLGILILLNLYAFTEPIGNWLHSKDDTAPHIYIRVCHLVLLLLCIAVLTWIFVSQLGH